MSYVMIAWTETHMVHDGEPFAVDLGYRPNLVETRVGKACVWRRTHDVDMESARAFEFVSKEHRDGVVFIYDDSESDPIGRAKTAILRGV